MLGVAFVRRRRRESWWENAFARLAESPKNAAKHRRSRAPSQGKQRIARQGGVHSSIPTSCLNDDASGFSAIQITLFIHSLQFCRSKSIKMKSIKYLFVVGITCVRMNVSSSFGAFAPSTESLPSRSRLFSSAGQGGGVFYDGPPQDQTGQAESSFGNDSSASTFPRTLKRHAQHKDVVIIGGGLAGLSAALHLNQLDPNRHITILERESGNVGKEKTTVASFAAAGMLAPQSERLPRGPLLDLCIASRRLYPDFVDLVETMAQDTEGRDYLWPSSSSSNDDDKPWSVGYVASGGFFAPAFAGDSVATWSPPEESGSATWLDAVQVRELEPNLHPDVVGGWWFPEDASVDARRLTCSLRAACVAGGVQIQTGAEVTSLDLVDGHCRGLWLASGKYLKVKSVLVANGAWMRNLLPVPIEPHKGQSISLRMPSDAPPMLRRVLFAQDTYIVPKADGRIVVGATVEAGSYDANVTPAGLMHIMMHALQLVPALADLPLEETWVGLRPTTPDKGPILGKTPWDNLFLAGGYWRNGVLLAPKTGQLLALLISGHPLSPSDQALLDAFAWDRFTSPERSATVAADTRYAASMHPIHRRSRNGVAAAVGTELGSYSSARSAAEERSQDRSALFGGGGDDALERAAEMGRKDADAFVYKDNDENVSSASEQTGLPSLPNEASIVKFPPLSQGSSIVQLNNMNSQDTSAKYEGSADAYTVPSQDDDEDELDLSSIYASIQQNKESVGDIEMGEAEPDLRVDTGFRIYHIDSETREERLVPPFTTPDEFAKMVANETNRGAHVNGAPPAERAQSASMSEQGDSIFDGYKAIEEANAEKSRDDTLKAMREARMKNRGESVPLNPDHQDSFTSIHPESSSQTMEEEDAAPLREHANLSDIYERIRQNKASASSFEMGDAPEDDRKDPGFRLYYVDPDTGDSHEVPPFTGPDAMVQMVRETKAGGLTTNGSNVEEEHENKTQEGRTDSIEETFDGYQDIQQANSRSTREEELEAMRAARRQNRIGTDEIDESKIGVQRND